MSPERGGAKVTFPHGPDGHPEVRGGGAERQYPPSWGQGRHLPEAGGLPVYWNLQSQHYQARQGDEPAQGYPAA